MAVLWCGSPGENVQASSNVGEGWILFLGKESKVEEGL